MRYTGPKNRIARREALDLGLKTPGSKSHASLLKRLNVRPGQHGARGRRKISEFGRQIREKQKLRYIFGVTEHQMKNYFQKAKAKTGNTGLYLSQYLEQRLDNVLFRLGFVPTRAAARQLIVHGHVTVNSKMMSVPSYQVREGDVVALKEESAKIPDVVSSMAKQDTIIPVWLERKGTLGKIAQTPDAENVEKQINLRLVIEYYSR